MHNCIYKYAKLWPKYANISLIVSLIMTTLYWKIIYDTNEAKFDRFETNTQTVKTNTNFMCANFQGKPFFQGDKETG